MLRKNLSTEHTEGTDHREFLVASLEILEEIFFKNCLRKKSVHRVIGSSDHRNLNGFRRKVFSDVQRLTGRFYCPTKKATFQKLLYSPFLYI